MKKVNPKNLQVLFFIKDFKLERITGYISVLVS
jgi:hypothetical protein